MIQPKRDEDKIFHTLYYTCAAQNFLNGCCKLCKSRGGDIPARNENQIIARRDPHKERSQRFAHPAFGAIPYDGIAQFFPGDERRARLRQAVRTHPQYNKRVGKCASLLPHPLYVGLIL